MKGVLGMGIIPYIIAIVLILEVVADFKDNYDDDE